MNNSKKPLILVLSGSHGVGKTTLAHQLGIDLQIMNRFSCTSAFLKSVLPDNSLIRNWNTYSKTDAKYIRKKLRKEAKFAGTIVANIANLSEETGENYIIEGIKLLPEFLPIEKVIFFYVYVADDNKYEVQFKEPTITRLRHRSSNSYSFVKKIGKMILQECKGYPVCKINNVGSPESVSRQMIKIIKKKYPDYRERYLWFEK